MPNRQWGSSSGSSSSSRSSSSRSSSSWSSSSHRSYSSWNNNNSNYSGEYSPEMMIIGLLVIGGILAWLFLSQLGERNASAARDRESTATTQAITEQDLLEMRTALKDDLPLWMEIAEVGKEVHVSASEAGFLETSNTKEVVYGRCDSEKFYVYVLEISRPYGISADTQGYGYIPGGDARSCHPRNWRIAGSVFADKDWYFVAIDTYQATAAALSTQYSIARSLTPARTATATPTRRP